MHGFEVDDLAFAHTERRRLTEAQHLQRAVRAQIGDGDAHFGRANFHADHNVFFTHLNALSCRYSVTILMLIVP